MVDIEQRLNNAYRKMLERTRETLDRTRKDGLLPTLEELIADAREKAVEIEELSVEEAEKIGNYLKRDLKDTAQFLQDSKKGLAEILSFDLELIEDKLLNVFSLMADHTKEELQRLKQQARQAEERHTGEITGLGTLVCTGCGQELHFHKPGHIPPCPKCHGSSYRLGNSTETD